jgi:serine/threonine protein kinase
LISFVAGQLLDHIQNRVKFTEKEASYVVRDLANALLYLHKKGNLKISIFKKHIKT